MSVVKPLSFLLIFSLALTAPLCQANETQSDMSTPNTLNVQPNIIPAPQKWIGGTGHFDIRPALLTTPHKQLSQLRPLIDMFRRDLLTAGATKTEMPTVSHSERQNKNDNPVISFAITPANGKPTPGQYTLTIKPDSITATAPTATGLFYASQSLLQLAMQSPQLPCGTITDYPDYRIRALMLDVGRKFFPYETLKDYIRTMGLMKLNELHLHISDNSFGKELYPGSLRHHHSCRHCSSPI